MIIGNKQAQLQGHASQSKLKATADQQSGDILQVGGIAGIITGASGPVADGGLMKSGDMINVEHDVLAYVRKADATVISDGAQVDWNDTTKLAVITGGTFSLGTAWGAAGSGQDWVLVRFNYYVTAAAN